MVFDRLTRGMHQSPNMLAPSLNTDDLGNIVATWSGGGHYAPAHHSGSLIFQAVRRSGAAWATRRVAAQSPFRRGASESDPTTLAAGSFLGPTVVTWASDDKIIAADATPAHVVAVRPLLRVPRLTTRDVLRDKRVTVSCSMPTAGYCSVQLLPTAKTRALVGDRAVAWCVTYGRAAKLAANRTASLRFSMPFSDPECRDLRRAMTRPGPDLTFRVVANADAIGRTSGQVTKILTLTR